MKKEELYIGVDQGSSATKGIVLDQDGVLVGECTTPAPEIHRNGAVVEQDPAKLLESVQQTLSKVLSIAKDDGRPLRAWGLAVQRSGVLAWHADTGEVVHPMITWADTRTQQTIDAFGPGVERISNATGLPVLANFAGPKIHLLQKRFLDPKILVATLDSYLLYRLTQGKVFITEDTMAARTMLYALAFQGWSEELCRQFVVDRHRLAPIRASLSRHAVVEGVPLEALLGDQQAALLGRLNSANRALLNLGTIASLCKHTGSTMVRKPTIRTSVLYSRNNASSTTRDITYLAEGIAPEAGTVLLEPRRRQWSADAKEVNAQCEAAWSANPAGLAVAYWRAKERSMPTWPHGIPNVTVCRPGAQTMDRVRAVVENVGNLIVRVIEEFSDKGLLGEQFPAQIDLAGGASELDYLMQYIADVSGHTFHKLPAREAGARGAALAAIMSVSPRIDVGALNDVAPLKTYRCVDPDRRKRYLMWQRMEQDVLNKRLPAQAEVEE
jgi:glycerol kinase